MIPMSIIGMFCEDIRLEKNDVVTLIGLLPDNILLRPSKGADGGRANSVGLEPGDGRWLNKLCIYARANFDPEDPVREIKFQLVFPKGEEVDLDGASEEIVERAKREAKENGSPLAGVIHRSEIFVRSFGAVGAGIVRLQATIGTETRMIAALNFREAKTASSASASEQPS